MKTIQMIILCSLMMVCSCNKDFTSDYSNGKATAYRHGIFWVGQGRGTLNNKGTGVNMSFEIYNKFGERRQNLTFGNIPTHPAINILTSQSADSIPYSHFFTLSADGDAIDGIYLVNESPIESYITVTKYDEERRILSGEFKVKFYIDPKLTKLNPNNPDTIVFDKGRFDVVIKE